MLFKTKIDIWAHILFIFIIIGMAVYSGVTFFKGLYFIGFALLAIAICIIIPIYLGTRYFADNENKILFINSGKLIKVEVKIENITKIQKTNTLLAGFALSLKRLKISYTNNNGIKLNVIVSPEDRENFQRYLLMINPRIDISDSSNGTKYQLHNINLLNNQLENESRP